MRYEDMEYMNYEHILRSIECDLENPSRADIAKHLGLSRTTVSTITNTLISWGVVSEGKGLSVSRGRPGNPLAINNRVWKVLGASFYSSSWMFVLCDLRGKILDTHKLEVGHPTPSALVASLIEGLQYMKGLYGDHLLPAVGIGVPGVVDTKNGDILFAHDFSWKNPFPVRSIVEREVGTKVFMKNRYCLAGIAECRYANPTKERNMIYIGLGSGISCAIFVDGKLVESDGFSAGRISHIQVDPDGKQCNCGKKGCLLTVANEWALVDMVLAGRTAGQVSGALASMSEGNIDGESVGAAADAGDTFACHCIDTLAKPLGKVIAMLVDVLNPGKIVIGGPVGYSCEYLVRKIERDLKRYPEYPPVANLRVERGRLREPGSALGAASLVIEHKLELLYPLFSSRLQDF